MGKYPDDDGRPLAAPAYRCPLEGCPNPGVANYNGGNAGGRYSTSFCDYHWRGPGAQERIWPRRRTT